MVKSAADGMDYNNVGNSLTKAVVIFFISNKDLGENGKTENTVLIFENGSKYLSNQFLRQTFSISIKIFS